MTPSKSVILLSTTTSITIAVSATSPRRSVMPGRMVPCSPPAMWSMRMHANATRVAGADRPTTGHQLAPSLSIQSATLSSERQPQKSSFLVRLASLLSRPDLATPKPRRATQGMGLGREERTNRSHPEPRAARPIARAWRGWRAPDLRRSEHRGILGVSRRFASPDIKAATTAVASIGEIVTRPKRQLS
jgi:hypothetical protein